MYYLDETEGKLINSFCIAIEDLYEITEQLAQYVYNECDRDRYEFLNRLAHCCDSYHLVEDLCKCFEMLCERKRNKYFRV